MTLSIQLKTIPLLVATSLTFIGCSSVNSDGLGSIVRPTTVVITEPPAEEDPPTILDPVIGPDGAIPVTSSPILDPIIGPDGVLPLTSDNFEGDGGLLDPVVGQGGLLPVTSPDGGELLDGVIGPDGLLPLTTGEAGSELPLSGILDNVLGGENGSTNQLLDPVVGPEGLLPLTSGEGEPAGLLDPVIGQEGLLPLTSGGSGDGTGSPVDGLLAPVTDLLGGAGTGDLLEGELLDPVAGPEGLLPLTSGEGEPAGLLDPVIGQEGLLPLTSGGSGDGTGSPIDGVLAPVTDLLGGAGTGDVLGGELLDPVVGPTGLLPLTSGEGEPAGLLDPIIGQDGLLPLTSGGSGDGTGSPLDNVLAPVTGILGL